MQTVEFFLHKGLTTLFDSIGYEHLLFVLALAGVYAHTQWKNVLYLGTAFALGYTLSFSAASFNIIRIAPSFSPILIPLTLLLLSVFHLFTTEEIVQQAKRKKVDKIRHPLFNKYSFVAFLGLGHGFDFYQKTAIALREFGTSALGYNVLGYSLGLYLGQILISILSLGIAWLFFGKGSMAHKNYIWLLSAAIFGISSSKIWDWCMMTQALQP